MRRPQVIEPFTVAERPCYMVEPCGRKTGLGPDRSLRTRCPSWSVGPVTPWDDRSSDRGVGRVRLGYARSRRGDTFGSIPVILLQSDGECKGTCDDRERAPGSSGWHRFYIFLLNFRFSFFLGFVFTWGSVQKIGIWKLFRGIFHRKRNPGTN